MNSLTYFVILLILLLVTGIPITLVYIYRKGYKNISLTISFLIIGTILFSIYAVISTAGKLEPPLKDLGNNYFIVHNSMDDIAIAKPIKGYPMDETYSFVVYGHIVDYAFDSTFILVAEKPRDSVPESRNLPFNEAQKVFKQNPFRQYYILNKKHDSLYGPYKKPMFIIKTKELNISENLKIK